LDGGLDAEDLSVAAFDAAAFDVAAFDVAAFDVAAFEIAVSPRGRPMAGPAGDLFADFARALVTNQL
jgi:hypothetical protein